MQNILLVIHGIKVFVRLFVRKRCMLVVTWLSFSQRLPSKPHSGTSGGGPVLSQHLKFYISDLSTLTTFASLWLKLTLEFSDWAVKQMQIRQKLISFSRGATPPVGPVDWPFCFKGRGTTVVDRNHLKQSNVKICQKVDTNSSFNFLTILKCNYFQKNWLFSPCRGYHQGRGQGEQSRLVCLHVRQRLCFLWRHCASHPISWRSPKIFSNT